MESNVGDGVFEAINFAHLSEKSLFLAILHHAPKRSEGRWHSQIKHAFEVGRLDAVATTRTSEPGSSEADETDNAYTF